MVIIVSSFLAVERARETAMAELSVTVSCSLRCRAMKLVVAQFCRAKDHEIINEGAEWVRSENVMPFLHHHQLASYEPVAT